MSCYFRNDVLVAATRKAHKCSWCLGEIEAGGQMVRVSGGGEDGVWSGKFHPECWRAEQAWWRTEGRPEYWPDDRMGRGRLDLDADQPPEFSTDPLTADEVAHPWQFDLRRGAQVRVAA